MTFNRQYQLIAESDIKRSDWIHTIRAHIQVLRSAATPHVVETAISEEDYNATKFDEAYQCDAHGTGLSDAIEGQYAEFLIVAKDEMGDPTTVGGKRFLVSLCNERLHYDLTAIDNGDGTYTVRYICKTAGEYNLNVLLAHDFVASEATTRNEVHREGYHIAGSPFAVTVNPDTTSAPQCIAAGEALARCEPNRIEHFFIYSRTQWDQPIFYGGDTFLISFEGPAELIDIVDNQNGTYTVSFKIVATPDDVMLKGLPRISISVQIADGKGMKILLHNDDIDAERRYGSAPRHIKSSPFYPIVCYEGTSGTKWEQSPAIPTHPESMLLEQQRLAEANSHYGHLSPGQRNPSINTGPSPAIVEIFKNSAAKRRENEKLLEAGVPIDISQIRQSLHAKQRAIEDEYKKLMYLRKQLENDRAIVDKQNAKISQLGYRVEEDSIKLMSKAKLLGLPEPKITSNVSIGRKSRIKSRDGSESNAEINDTSLSPSKRRGASPTRRQSILSPTVTSQIRDVRGSSNIDKKDSINGGSGRSSLGSPITSSRHSPMITKRKSPHSKKESTRSPGKKAGDIGLRLKSAELFDKSVSELLDRYNNALYVVFTQYGNEGVTPDDSYINIEQFTNLLNECGVTDKFISKDDIKKIMDVSTNKKRRSKELQGLSWGEFVEALVRTSIVALSDKKGISELYPTNAGKLAVLLEMWGLIELAR